MQHTIQTNGTLLTDERCELLAEHDFLVGISIDGPSKPKAFPDPRVTAEATTLRHSDGSGSAPTGTIDPTTGAFVIEWSSLISGGAFDGFTGVWHLQGTFTPSA